MNPRTLFLASVLAFGTAHATEYVVPLGTDVGIFFANLPSNATYVSFSGSDGYSSAGDIVLPFRRLLVIDGKGANLNLGPNSRGFTDSIGSMSEAMIRTGSRYVIKDFGRITGGRKAIDLRASLLSEISDMELSNQTECAINLHFCLLATVRNILVTNPVHDGIRVGCGDWPGATGTNSQSNCTTLDHCRVYAYKSTDKAFTITDCNGIVMRDCVSEGSPVNYDLYLSAMNGVTDTTVNSHNPVVKNFTMSGFHVEHDARIASLYLNMPSMAVMDISAVYFNATINGAPIMYAGGQLVLHDIGWWDDYKKIVCKAGAPRITIRDSHQKLDIGKIKLSKWPYPGNTVLVTPYVFIGSVSK